MKKILQFLLLMSAMTMSIFAGSKDYVLVNGGSFVMGSERGNLDEEPLHKVKLSSFYMSKYEVTQKEFTSVMGFNPSKFISDNNPVERLTWYDAVMYANKLSQIERKTPYYMITNIEKEGNRIIDAIVTIVGGKGYRLPTEAEWEYAARGGKQSKGYKYSGSNKIDEVAEYAANSRNTTKPICDKKSNELGIYDMTGNVWEWCFDWYGEYSSKSQTNPTGPLNGTYRVLRGGSFTTAPSYSTVTTRFTSTTNYANYIHNYNKGFRLVRTL